MNAEPLKRLIRSHRRNDEEAFVDAAEQLIVAERRQGHVRIADDLDLAAALREKTHTSPKPREQIATVHEVPRSKVDVELVAGEFTGDHAAGLRPTSLSRVLCDETALP